MIIFAAMIQVWLSAAGLSLATLIGVILGLFVKGLPEKWNDSILGYCAGAMLGVSCMELIPSAFELPGEHNWWIAVAGAVAGLLFMGILHHVAPHTDNHRLDSVILFVTAIALHKIPDGIATGVGFNAEDTTAAWAVTLGIAIHSIPEGMATIIPLLLAGVSKLKSILIALALIVLEVGGVWLGYGVGSISGIAFALMLSFSGTSLLFVVCEEIIPESYSHGYKHLATIAIIAGIFTMALVELHH